MKSKKQQRKLRYLHLQQLVRKTISRQNDTIRDLQGQISALKLELSAYKDGNDICKVKDIINIDECETRFNQNGMAVDIRDLVQQSELSYCTQSFCFLDNILKI